MDATRKRALCEAAIRAAHDVLAPDDFRQPHNSLGDEFGMLDDVGGVTDHAWDQHFAGRQFCGFPNPPFVGVAGIGGLERVMADAHLQEQTMMSLSGTSKACGPFQLPQQM